MLIHFQYDEPEKKLVDYEFDKYYPNGLFASLNSSFIDTLIHLDGTEFISEVELQDEAKILLLNTDAAITQFVAENAQRGFWTKEIHTKYDGMYLDSRLGLAKHFAFTACYPVPGVVIWRASAIKSLTLIVKDAIPAYDKFDFDNSVSPQSAATWMRSSTNHTVSYGSSISFTNHKVRY